MTGWLAKFLPSRQRKSATIDKVILAGLDDLTYTRQLSAIQCTTVSSCIRVLREALAQSPCIIYKRQQRGKDRAVDHHLYPLLHNSPNLNMNAFEYWEGVVTDILYRGNHYSLKVFVGDELRELIPLPPDCVTPKLSQRGIKTYEVRVSGVPTRVYTSREIFHVKDYSVDGVVGLSRIAVNRITMSLCNSLQHHAERMFRNGGKPGGILTVPMDLSKEDKEILKNEWDSKTGGGNLYSTVVMPQGTTWASMGMTSTDAQFLETMKYNSTQICGIFGVPPHKIGDLERATFSNIEHQGIEFVTNSVMPLARRIESAINTQLIPLHEQSTYYGEFLLDALLRGDMKSRMDAFAVAIQNRVLSPNEVREIENRNPYPGGDTYDNPAITPGKGDTANAAKT